MKTKRSSTTLLVRWILSRLGKGSLMIKSSQGKIYFKTESIFLTFRLSRFILRIPSPHRCHRMSRECFDLLSSVPPAPPHLTSPLHQSCHLCSPCLPCPHPTPQPSPSELLFLVPGSPRRGVGGRGGKTVSLHLVFFVFPAQRHFSVMACLVPLCSLHGAAVTTVEGVGSIKTRLHPVQVSAHSNLLTSELHFAKGCADCPTSTFWITM